MNKIIYLDAAASALKPEIVIKAEKDFLQNDYANAGRGICSRAAAVDKSLLDVRKKVCDFINADSPSQIIFTSGSTDGLNRIVNILNASKQQLVSNDNNEIKIDSTGILCRKWIEERQIYDAGQIWITNNQIAITSDSWASVGLALGYVKVDNEYFFGLCKNECFYSRIGGVDLNVDT